MPIDPESIENFQRGTTGDSFLGIVDTTNSTMFLALALREDGIAIPDDRRSTIGQVTRTPLPGAGGHAQLANWAGVNATQAGPGAALGGAFGFSLVKTDPSSFRIGTYRSGFNSQTTPAMAPRPGFAQGTLNEARTLDQDAILNRLLPELTAGLLGTRQRRASM